MPDSKVLTNGTSKEDNSTNNATANGQSDAVHTSKAGLIRDKFEKGETEKAPKTKRPTKVRYAGVESAKSKFIEEAEKVNREQEPGERKPRQITPPRDGVNSGIIESQPQARAPGVVGADDPVMTDDIQEIVRRTKDLRARFKQMEEGKLTQDEKSKVLREFSELSPDEIKKIKSQWQNIESGQSENNNFHSGGVDMEALKDLNSKERREALLKMAEESQKNLRKINPTEELKRLAEEQKNAVYENSPEQRQEDIVPYSGSELDDFKTLSSAKSTREKFVDGSAYKSEFKKTVVEIAAEQGGVFENDPVARTDVVKHDDEDKQDGVNGKWASEAKKRLMESAKTQDQTPEPKPIDEVSGGKYASDARKKFMERQKELEQAENAKSRPEIIDIWSDLCEYSGVFENQPAERSKDIVVCGESSDEEGEESQTALANGTH